MTALTPDQLAELKQELERELARLHRSMATTQNATGPVELDQSSIGRLSRVEALQSQQLTKGLHEREQQREALILEALQRIEEGTYGTCVGCGAAIPYGRLLVMPEARSCTNCGRG